MTPRLLLPLALVLTSFAFSACGSEPKPVPNVVGERLDVARSTAEDAGLEVEVIGGGTFGVLDETNWKVCRTEPAVETPAEHVKLIVERECGSSDTSESGSATSSKLSGDKKKEFERIIAFSEKDRPEARRFVDDIAACHARNTPIERITECDFYGNVGFGRNISRLEEAAEGAGPACVRAVDNAHRLTIRLDDTRNELTNLYPAQFKSRTRPLVERYQRLDNSAKRALAAMRRACI